MNNHTNKGGILISTLVVGLVGVISILGFYSFSNSIINHHNIRIAKIKAFYNVEELLKITKEQYPSAKAVAITSASINKEEFQSTTELNVMAQAWLALTKDEQKEQIELVLDEHIRPALMNDGGNVMVLDVTDGQKILVQYQGACGSCGSSLGATLSFMESTLRKHIYNELNVIPQM